MEHVARASAVLSRRLRNPPVVPPDLAPPSGAVPFAIRDRLIELDDLRKRGIISEEEFAAKKSELLNRI